MIVEIIVFVFSLGFFVLGINLWNNGSYLRKNGKTTDAIIFRNEADYNRSNNVLYYPVVRFITEEKEWITQRLSTGYYPAKKEGITLSVIYYPEDPTKVSINAAFELKIMPVVFMAIGFIALVFGLLELFEITSIIKD